MWIANRWKDYQVIDCSCGEKLERWGKYTLVRPDPQVIWNTPKTEKGWTVAVFRLAAGMVGQLQSDNRQRTDLQTETIQFQAYRCFP